MILIKSIFPSIKHPHITNTCNTEVSWHAWLHVKKLMPWLLYAFKLACFYATTGARSKSPSPTQKSTSLINTSKQFICLSWNCAVSVLCSCVFYLFIYLFVFMLTRKGEKKGKKCMVQKTKFITSPTWWGAGSIERGAGAGGITGATGLSLVEGPFQLPPPLDPAVLLTEVLEDLLCGGQTGNKKNRIKNLLTHAPNTETFDRRNDGQCKLSRSIWCKL